MHLVKSSENVKIKSSRGTSPQQYGKCHVDGVGETLVLSLRQTSRPRALTRVKVKVNVKAKVNGTHQASPRQGVAKIDVAKEVISHQQCYSPIPMGRKDHGGSDSAGGFRPA